jgi:hypothetical protein
MTERRSISELQELHPSVPFELVHYGSLPRNHVAFRVSAEGFAYIPDIVSPSLRYGIAGGIVRVRYEGSAKP